jgi:cobalt/nickel transport system permease protein
MSLVTAYGGYAVFALLRRLFPATRTGVVVASGLAGCASVVMASVAFVVEYALGGQGSASVGTVLAAMAGVHTLIGIGEGIITALTVGVVLSVRPDLVYGAHDLLPRLELRTADVAAKVAA